MCCSERGNSGVYTGEGTLSIHDALPIWDEVEGCRRRWKRAQVQRKEDEAAVRVS